MGQTNTDFAFSLIAPARLVQADLDAFRERLDTVLLEFEAAETKLNALLDVIENAAYPVADHVRPT
jgi:hypothetical protein